MLKAKKMNNFRTVLMKSSSLRISIVTTQSALARVKIKKTTRMRTARTARTVEKRVDMLRKIYCRLRSKISTLLWLPN